MTINKKYLVNFLIAFTSIQLFAQDAAKPTEPSVTTIARVSFVKPEEGVKPSTKAVIFEADLQKEVHTYRALSPRVYLFEDSTEKRSGYGVWWCTNYLGTSTWPNRIMFLAGLNQEGDYLLYYADRSSTRNGSTQRFSPKIFKKDENGILEKLESENSKISIKFTPKFKEAEMVSITMDYRSPTQSDYKTFTRKDCEKY